MRRTTLDALGLKVGDTVQSGVGHKYHILRWVRRVDMPPDETGVPEVYDLVALRSRQTGGEWDAYPLYENWVLADDDPNGKL